MDDPYSAVTEGLASSIEKLTPRQRERLKIWTDLQATLNRGDFVKMDEYFADNFTYSNPNRPDLGTYKQWKTSPVELYKRFPPSHYETLAASGYDDDQIWVFCHHYGAMTGGRYMGIEPQGQEISVHWFSIVKFSGEKILSIYSIADVLGMFTQVGAIDLKSLAVDPYR